MSVTTYRTLQIVGPLLVAVAIVLIGLFFYFRLVEFVLETSALPE